MVINIVAKVVKNYLPQHIFSYICAMKRAQEHKAYSSIEEILKQWWGYDTFRPFQREIIESVLAHHDTLALMPTGGGKSLTYQIPALALDGLTIVITPLIALMKDQVDKLRSMGIAAVAIHSGLDPHRIELALDNCTYGDTKLLYVSPERLNTELFRTRLRRMNVSLVAVDEAHCISQWGYDFRPSYLNIAKIRPIIPDATFLALTASATELVAKDIMLHLQFREPYIIRSKFARPNLSYAVRQTEDKYEQLLRIVDNVAGSGIIYARTREGVEKLTAQLQRDGYSASFYHAGLPTVERSIRQDEWLNGKVRIIVATNAFGMGIDKPDVRFVVHFSMCDSLEAYYQEAGRAGRDGKRSYAVLLTSADDAKNIAKRFEAEFPPIDSIKHIYERIANFLQVPIGDGADSSFVFNMHEFCHRERLFSGTVISALKLLEENDYMSLLDEHDNPARLMFTCSRDSLYKLNVGGNDMDMMLNTLLRMYDGLFSNFRQIDELKIAAACELSMERVHELLKILWRTHVVRYIPSSRSPMIRLHTERLPIADIYISPETYHHRYRSIHERFENMLRYTTNTTECRSLTIEHYFGDMSTTECGVCDLCLKRKRESMRSSRATNSIEQSILNTLKQKPLCVKELMTLIGGNATTVVDTVDKMLKSGKISLLADGKLGIIE